MCLKNLKNISTRQRCLQSLANWPIVSLSKWLAETRAASDRKPNEQCGMTNFFWTFVSSLACFIARGELQVRLNVRNSNSVTYWSICGMRLSASWVWQPGCADVPLEQIIVWTTWNLKGQILRFFYFCLCWLSHFLKSVNLGNFNLLSYFTTLWLFLASSRLLPNMHKIQNRA